MPHLPALDAQPGEKLAGVTASAGMYTHLVLSQVPVGQFKIGLIAQNASRIISNVIGPSLASSADRMGSAGRNVAFAGYPRLLIEVVGVMACFLASRGYSAQQ